MRCRPCVPPAPLYVFYLLVAFANAAVTPPKSRGVGFQSSPSTRGTLNIIENCVFTIIACTWTIQHPNIPAPTDKGRTTFFRRCKWTFLNILAPEFLLAQAIDHRIWAHQSFKYLKTHLKFLFEEDVSWYRRLSGTTDRRSSDADTEAGTKHNVKWTIKHCYYGNMGGFVLKPDDDFVREALELGVGDELAGKEYPVTTEELVACVKKSSNGAGSDSMVDEAALLEVFKHIRQLSVEDIEDRDKADYFSRMVALVQTLWLVFSVSARKARHLATTQLEVITLAFAGCAFLTYICRWDKPQNIKLPTGIPLRLDPNLKPTQHPLRFYHIMMHGSKPNELRGYRLKNDIIRPKQFPPFDMLSLLIIAMVPVGCIHLLAWNFAFPTPEERLLWRTMSLISIALPVVLLLCVLVFPVTIGPLLNWMEKEGAVDDARAFLEAILDAMDDYDNTWLDQKQTGASVDADEETSTDEEDASEGSSSDRSSTSDGAGASSNIITPFEIARQRLRQRGKEKVHYKQIFREGAGLDMDKLSTDLDKLRRQIKRDKTRYQLNCPKFYAKYKRLRLLVLSAANELPAPPSAETNSPKPKTFTLLRNLVDRLTSPPPPDEDVDDVGLFPRPTRRVRIDSIRESLLRWVSPLVGGIYAVSRLVVIALAFSCFRDMPETVYQTTWTRYIPVLQ